MPNSQREEVIKYMRDHGGITALESAKDLNITQLSARISEIEKQGFVINREPISGTNIYGRKWKGLRYSIDEQATRKNIALRVSVTATGVHTVSADDLAVMP
jgi:predicted ArsR family transcriptional regulator